MNENSSEVNELIKDTEKRYGKKLYSPIDFEEFVERLNASGLYNLSISTLKDCGDTCHIRISLA